MLLIKFLHRWGIGNEDTGSFEISFKDFKRVWREVLGLKREEDLSLYCCAVLGKSHLLSGAQVHGQ